MEGNALMQSVPWRPPTSATRLAAALRRSASALVRAGGSRRRRLVGVLFSAAGLMLGASSARAEVEVEVEVVIVVGAGGTEEYATQFGHWAERWQAVANSAAANVTLVGPHPNDSDAPERAVPEPESAPPESAPPESAQPENAPPESTKPADRERLLESLGRLKSAESGSPLWLVLIGHGTFQQGQAKFNLRGPDVSAEELAGALGGAARPLVIINSASASGPFLAALTGENRVVVTATRSGDEQNFARFGDYLSRAIGDLSTDLDHDASVSILEAFLAASHQTRQFYEREGRLATEHALIDDNGDAQGTSADFFRGIRIVGAPEGKAQPDGELAAGVSLLATPEEMALPPEQRQRIAEIEHSVRDLRARKSELETEEYFSELERLMVEMAELYEAASAPDS